MSTIVFMRDDFFVTGPILLSNFTKFFRGKFDEEYPGNISNSWCAWCGVNFIQKK